MQRGSRRALLALSLAPWVVACSTEPKLVVREERLPLERRVNLPSGVRRVRWVAVPAFIDSGWLEAPEKPYRLYAFLELPSPAPSGATSATRKVLLPESVARAILPPAVPTRAAAQANQVEVDAALPPEAIAVRTAGVAVTSADRVPGGVLLQLYLPGGS